MVKDQYFRLLLIVIAVLLVLNLFSQQISSFLTQKAEASRMEPVPIRKSQASAFRGNGVGIACSSDGRYVYAASNNGVYRSTAYGESGSWELVLE